MARSNEPILWATFSAGGVVAALIGPALIFLLGLAGSLGWLGTAEMFSYDHLHRLFVGHPIAKLVMFPIIVLPMWHWAHRFRYVLVDMGLHAIRVPIAGICYTTALAVTGSAGWVLFNL